MSRAYDVMHISSSVAVLGTGVHTPRALRGSPSSLLSFLLATVRGNRLGAANSRIPRSNGSYVAVFIAFKEHGYV